MGEPIDLDAIKARCAAATPGPWVWTLNGYETRLDSLFSGRPCVMGFRRKGMNGAQPVVWTRDPAQHPAWHGECQKVGDLRSASENQDLTFIARARTDVADLIAEVERLRALVDMYVPKTEVIYAVAPDRSGGDA